MPKSNSLSCVVFNYIFLMTDINLIQKAKASFRVFYPTQSFHYFFEIFGKDAQGTIPFHYFTQYLPILYSKTRLVLCLSIYPQIHRNTVGKIKIKKFSLLCKYSLHLLCSPTIDQNFDSKITPSAMIFNNISY